MARFPNIDRRLGLGLGLDMPWSKSGTGFRASHDGADTIPDSLSNFFANYRARFDYAFVAFQPRGRAVLNPADYHTAYDIYFSEFEAGERRPRAFHQTLLNMGTTDNYPHAEVCDFTNALTERYGFEWILEDLGIWSIKGKSLPYPLPPVLTEPGLECCLRNIGICARELSAPLSVEFPGFSEGVSFYVGSMDAFDYFRTLIYETGCCCTIDIGHIISYQWLVGRGGPEYFSDFLRLPLDCCFELHLSGCQIKDGKFRDLHNGILLDEQILALEYIIPHCPFLKAITYEDPKYTRDGILVPKSIPNFDRMDKIVRAWAADDPVQHQKALLGS